MVTPRRRDVKKKKDDSDRVDDRKAKKKADRKSKKKDDDSTSSDDSSDDDDSSEDSLRSVRKVTDTFVFEDEDSEKEESAGKKDRYMSMFLDDVESSEDEKPRKAPSKRDKEGRKDAPQRTEGRKEARGDDRKSVRKEEERKEGGRKAAPKRTEGRKEARGDDRSIRKDIRKEGGRREGGRRDDRNIRKDIRREEGRKEEDNKRSHRKSHREARKEDPKFIAKGAYGDVFEYDSKHGKLAVKNFKDYPSFLQESVALRYLENVSEVVRWESFDSKNIKIGMEKYMSNMRSAVRGLSTAQIDSVLIDILQGLNAIHSLGLVHGDLKMANILIDTSNGSKAYIGDLGFVSKAGYSRIHRTTPNAKDPKPVNSYVHDMFSFGVLLCKIFSKEKLPHIEDNEDYTYDDYIRLAEGVTVRKYRTIALNLLSDRHSDRHNAAEVISIISASTIIKSYSSPDLPSSSKDSPYSHEMRRWECNQVDNGCRCLNYLITKYRPSEDRIQDYVNAVIILLLSCFSSSKTIIKFSGHVPNYVIMNEILTDPYAVKYILA